MTGPQPGKALSIFLFVMLCLIWGTTWSVIAIGLEGIPPFTGVSLRFLIAAILLLVLIGWRGIKLGGHPREKMLWWINGILSFSVSYGVVYWAEQWVPSGLASVLFATYPLFVAILAHFMLPAETATRRELVGVVAGFAGVGVIFSEDFTALGGPHVALAAAVMLISPFVSAIASVVVKRWGAGVHPFSLTAVPMAIAAGVMGALALATERDVTLHWTPVSIGALVYLAIAGSAVTFSLYYWLLAHFPAKRLALIAYVIPVEAVLIGTVFRSEPLTARIVGGALLVLLGVALAVHRPAPPTS